MQINGRVVHLRVDPALAQPVVERAPARSAVAVADDEQVVPVNVAGRRCRGQDELVDVGEQLPVDRGDLVPALDETAELSELRPPERTLDVGEPVVEAERVLFLMPSALVRTLE